MTRYQTAALSLAASAALAALVVACLSLAAIQALHAAQKPLPAGCQRAYQPVKTPAGPLLVEVLVCKQLGRSA